VSMKHLEAWAEKVFEGKPIGKRRAITATEIVSMFTAFAQPDVTPEKPVDWNGGYHATHSEKKPVSDCQHEKDERPAPPTPEQLGEYELTGEYRDPAKGEYAWSGIYERVAGPVEHWLEPDPRWILRRKQPKFKPGDKVRYDDDAVTVTGIIEQLNDESCIKFRRLIGWFEVEHLTLLEKGKEGA
jgi:hypothetical protein